MAAPSPAPATPPPYSFEWGPSPSTTSTTAGAPAKANPDFSPPLIAMVAVIGTAFLIVFYVRILSRHLRYLRRRFRRWRRRRRLFHSTVAASSDLGSPPPPFPFPPFDPSASDHYYFLSPYGLDDTAIKTLPLSQYSKSKAKLPAATHRDCAVCLLDFEDDDSLRTLPLCGHSFHVDCIDVWLRSHATCPLCRAAVFRQEYSCSPFVPMRAARIRPSLDDLLFDPTPEAAPLPPEPEITEINGEDHGRENRDFLLKRSYSFGFERSLAADRMVTDASTSSPWRGYRQRSFWSKRWPSPFVGSSSASRAGRVFSFRSYGRGFAVKSPFLRRRGFFNLSSEPPNRFGPSSRRSQSMTSPSAIFMRPPLPGASVLGFSSSRLRCGDPEALLSPERLDRR